MNAMKEQALRTIVMVLTNRDFNTSYGVLKIKMPRDRNNEFQSPLVAKYNRKDNTIEETILKLF